MATFQPMGDGLTAPDISTVRESLVGQDIGLSDVITNLVGTVVDRTTTQEDTLTPVYKLAISDATAAVDASHDTLGGVAVPLINDVRAKIGTTAGKLTAVMTETPAVVRDALTVPLTECTDSTNKRYYVQMLDITGTFQYCPSAIFEAGCPEPDTGGKASTTYGPFDLATARDVVLSYQSPGSVCATASTVPPVVPPPAPPPVIEPPPPPPVVPPTVCPSLEPTDCFVKVPCKPIIVGPSPPGIPPKPVPIPPEPPTPSPEPPPTPSPPPPAEEAAPPEFKPPERSPEEEIVKPSDCKTIDYAAPNLCACVEQHLTWFSEFGKSFLNETNWADNASYKLSEYDISVRKSAIGVSLIKLVSNKIKYSDPTFVDVARELAAIAETEFQQQLAYAVSNWWDNVSVMNEAILFGRKFEIVGLYLCKSILDFVEDTVLGFFSAKYGGKSVSIQFTHFRKIVDLCLSYVYPLDPPSTADAESLWLTGKITDDQARCYTRLNGNQWDATKPAWLTRRSQPSVDDYFAYYWRHRDKWAALDAKLLGLGFKNQEERDLLKESKTFLPSPSVLTHWTIRDVFDPQKLGLDEMRTEFTQQKNLQELYDAIGMGDTDVTTSSGKRINVQTAMNDWIASYVECSPTQSYEMLHRLRANRVRRLKLPGQTEAEADKMVTDITTVRKLLKEADYNPIWRDRLAALSYRVIGRIDVRRMYQYGVFGAPKGSKGFARINTDDPWPVGEAEKELVERYQDMGSTQNDARLQALFTVRLWEESQRRKNRNRVVRTSVELYSNGVTDRQAAKRQLLSVTDTEAEAEQLLDNADAQNKLRTVKYAVSAIKRQYMTFQIDSNTAKQRLNQIGVQPRKAVDLTLDWDIIRLKKTKQETASEMCKWFGSGLIDRKEFSDRLQKLGYEAQHAERIIRQCETGVAQRSAREMQRIARLKQQQTRQIAAAQAKINKEATAVQEKRLSRFLATQTDKHWIDWYQNGLITIPELTNTLLMKGYTPEDAKRWILTYAKPKN